MAKAIATYFDVRTVEDCGGYPKVIVTAELSIIATKSIVASIDNAKMRGAMEQAASESCKLLEVK